MLDRREPKVKLSISYGEGDELIYSNNFAYEKDLKSGNLPLFQKWIECTVRALIYQILKKNNIDPYNKFSLEFSVPEEKTFALVNKESLALDKSESEV